MSAALRMVGDGFSNTSVRLPNQTLAALRMAAAERAIRSGGRLSISAVIAELVPRHLAVPPVCAAAHPTEEVQE
jgi:hypothetical protein